jgi:hypothetical protein
VLGRDTRNGMLFQPSPPQGCISQDGSGGQCTTGHALRQAFSIAVTPDSRHVYAAARGDDAVAVLKRQR